MNLPKDGDPITQDQVDLALNLSKFAGAAPGSKGWHTGLFEPWALKFGYPDGMPVYAEVNVSGQGFHIYYLNDGWAAPLIMKKNETPADYGIQPKAKATATTGK